MNPLRKEKERSIDTPLKVIAGGKRYSSHINLVTNIAWIFLTSTLWNTAHFSSKERVAAKKMIRDYLLKSKAKRNSYRSFFERVLLARTDQAIYRHLPVLPSVWLDPDNVNGIASTQEAYLRMMVLRQSLPLHQYCSKALAEAILDFGEEPTPANYRYWKNYFTEKRGEALLQLFQVFASNYSFKN